jgi:intein-encoded DNA endonuclease-like protein
VLPESISKPIKHIEPILLVPVLDISGETGVLFTIHELGILRDIFNSKINKTTIFGWVSSNNDFTSLRCDISNVNFRTNNLFLKENTLYAEIEVINDLPNSVIF